MSFCVKCGTELPESAAFCNKCGTAIATNQQVVFVRPKVPGRGLGISSMVLGIIGLVYSFAFVTTLPSMSFSLNRYRRYDEEVVALFTPIILLSILSILSLCFAPVAIKRGYKNGISISGLIMGTIGLLGYIYVAFYIMSYM